MKTALFSTVMFVSIRFKLYQLPFSELGCSQYKQAQCILRMQLLIEMKLCRKLFVKLPCTLVIITGPFEVSVDVGACLSVSTFHTDQHLSGTRRRSSTNTTVDHQSWCVSTYSLVQEKNPSKCRRLQSTVGVWQSHTSGPTGSEGRSSHLLLCQFSCMSQSLNGD